MAQAKAHHYEFVFKFDSMRAFYDVENCTLPKREREAGIGAQYDFRERGEKREIESRRVYTEAVGRIGLSEVKPAATTGGSTVDA